MDWPVTARTQVPHVRETIADRELETWAVVDLSASLDFGTADCQKRDLAIAGLAAVGHLTVHGGNRLGAVVTTGERVDRYPAMPGRLAAERLLRTVVATPRAAGGRRGDLAAALETLRRPPRRRGLVVVISDFLGDSADWERPLRGLSARHELLAIEVRRPARAGAARRRPADRRRPRDRPDARGADRQRGVPRAVRRGRRGPAGARSPRRCAAPAPGTCSCAPTGTG